MLCRACDHPSSILTNPTEASRQMALPTKMVPASSQFLAHRKVLLCHSLVSGLLGFCVGQTGLAFPRSLLLTLRTQKWKGRRAFHSISQNPYSSKILLSPAVLLQMFASLSVYPCVSDRGSCSPGWLQSHYIAEGNQEILIWYASILDVVDRQRYEDRIISEHLQQCYNVTAGERPWSPLLFSLYSLLRKL